MLLGFFLGPHIFTKANYSPLRFSAGCGIRIETPVDDPVPEVFQVAVAGPRVAVQLQGLEISQPHEDLLPDRLELVIVDVDGLDAVAQVVEGVPVDLRQRVV